VLNRVPHLHALAPVGAQVLTFHVRNWAAAWRWSLPSYRPAATTMSRQLQVLTHSIGCFTADEMQQDGRRVPTLALLICRPPNSLLKLACSASRPCAAPPAPPPSKKPLPGLAVGASSSSRSPPILPSHAPVSADHRHIVLPLQLHMTCGKALAPRLRCSLRAAACSYVGTHLGHQCASLLWLHTVCAHMFQGCSRTQLPFLR
jgi:hypothetical protein